MGMKKLSAAILLVGFAALPANAAQLAGERVITQGQLISTAACHYGYAKNKKTGKCVELKCKKSEKLDKNGHKCVPKAAAKKRRVYRGSH